MQGMSAAMTRGLFWRPQPQGHECGDDLRPLLASAATRAIILAVAMQRQPLTGTEPCGVA